jgi:integrase
MLLDSYIQFAEAKGRAPATILRSRENFRIHVQPFYEQADMTIVTIEEHEKFLSVALKKGLKPASVNRLRSLLTVMYSVATKKRLYNGAFARNPFSSIERLCEVKKTIGYWNKDDIDKFLTSERSSFYYPLWITWLNTGLRIGELIAISREQIDTQAEILTVDRTWCGKTDQIRFVPKSKRIRHVGLNLMVQKVLFPILKDGLIFTREDGSQLTHAYLRNQILTAACEKAKVKRISPHGFRHTYGAQYMMSKGSLWDLQKILGHSDMKTTEEFYAHFSREHVQKRARVISLGENVIGVDFKRGVA